MATRLLLLLAFALPLQAAEVAGVKFDDRLSVGGDAISVSGAGLRQRFIFDVYAMALYVKDPKADRIAQGGAKRVAIRMLRDVDADTFSKALIDGMRPNHDEATMRSLAAAHLARAEAGAGRPEESAARQLARWRTTTSTCRSATRRCARCASTTRSR